MLTLEDLRIERDNFTLRAEMELHEGRRYAVIGPSGSGKSTLLGALCGFVPVASGRLVRDGVEITDRHPGRRGMTMLFQDNNLFPHLTVAQNVGLGLRPDLKLRREDHARIDAALARVGLEAHAGRRPGTLSGGQQSRVALARVLVGQQPWVLLDEPFAALGPALRVEMLTLVQDLAAETGAGLIMVTHAPDDVRRIAQEVIFVEGGRARAPVPATELLDNPPPELRAYLG